MNQIGVGKRGVLEIERFEFRQTLEARAADFRAINPELDKLGQALEVNQAGVRDRYVVKRQVFQLGHVFEVNQSGIGNRTTTQIESVDQGMFLEDGQVFILGRRRVLVAEIDGRHRGTWAVPEFSDE